MRSALGPGGLAADRRGAIPSSCAAGGGSGGQTLASVSLGGRRLGVVGLGAVGAAVARRAEAFGLEVGWWGPRDKPDAPWTRAGSLLDLAGQSDILVIACRADAETRGLIGPAVLNALGAHGLLVNVSHGQAVDETALAAALREGRLGMAALDVFEDEATAAKRWEGVPNTVLTPHTAGATSGALPRMAALTRENLRRFFAGEPLANPLVE